MKSNNLICWYCGIRT